MNGVYAIALAVSVVLNVVFAALFFKYATSVSEKLDRAHARTTEYTGELVDRLMAVDYAQYQASKYTVEELERQMQPVGAAEVKMEVVERPGADRGGFGSRLGLSALSARRELNEKEAQAEAAEELALSALPAN